MASPRIVPTGVLGGIAGKDGSNVLPTDTAIKQAIENPASQTAVALSASIEAATSPRALARARASVVRAVGWAGDSITNNNGPSGAGFKTYVPLLSRGRVTQGLNFSAGGVTAREWLDLYADDVLATPPRLLPGRVNVMLGTNDVGRGGYDLATSKADLIDVYDLWESVGVLPIANTIPPRNDLPGTRIPLHNDMIRALAASRGYLPVDYYATLDNGSGAIDAQYLRDGGADPVHPDEDGYERMSLAAFGAYRDTAPTGTAATAGQSIRKRNLCANGLFATAGGKYDGVPDRADYPLGWSTNENAPGEFVTDTQAEGRWYRFKGPSSGNALHQLAVLGIEPGHRISVATLIRAGGTSVGVRNLSVEFRAPSYGNPRPGVDVLGAGGVEIARSLGNRVLEYVYEATAPASDVGMIFLNVQVSAGSTIDVAEIEVVDLTAQGLA